MTQTNNMQALLGAAGIEQEEKLPVSPSRPKRRREQDMTTPTKTHSWRDTAFTLRLPPASTLAKALGGEQKCLSEESTAQTALKTAMVVLGEPPESEVAQKVAVIIEQCTSFAETIHLNTKSMLLLAENDSHMLKKTLKLFQIHPGLKCVVKPIYEAIARRSCETRLQAMHTVLSGRKSAEMITPDQYDLKDILRNDPNIRSHLTVRAIVETVVCPGASILFGVRHVRFAEDAGVNYQEVEICPITMERTHVTDIASDMRLRIMYWAERMLSCYAAKWTENGYFELLGGTMRVFPATWNGPIRCSYGGTERIKKPFPFNRRRQTMFVSELTITTAIRSRLSEQLTAAFNTALLQAQEPYKVPESRLPKRQRLLAAR